MVWQLKSVLTCDTHYEGFSIDLLKPILSSENLLIVPPELFSVLLPCSLVENCIFVARSKIQVIIKQKYPLNPTLHRSPSASNSFITFIYSYKSSSYPGSCLASLITWANQTRGPGLSCERLSYLHRWHNHDLAPCWLAWKLRKDVCVSMCMHARVCVCVCCQQLDGCQLLQAERSNPLGETWRASNHRCNPTQLELLYRHRPPVWHTAHILTPQDANNCLAFE